VSPCLTDALLDSVCQHVLGALTAGKQRPDIVRTYVQGVGILSRAVGYRFVRCCLLRAGFAVWQAARVRVRTQKPTHADAKTPLTW
jgi:hypothetical protein